jgi:hypothetical protein
VGVGERVNLGIELNSPSTQSYAESAHFLVEESLFFDAVDCTFLGGFDRAKNSTYERGA